MQFFNDTKFEDFIDKDVHVIVTSDSDVCDTLPLCHTFLREGSRLRDMNCIRTGKARPGPSFPSCVG